MIRNKKGFSLVELMVVVAIIGILSAIAIPQINKYMARARQTEAKTNLASVYTANKAFFAEYNIYDSRFDVIGYRPEGRLRYRIGWTAGCQAGVDISGFGYTAPMAGATANICDSNAFCPVSGGQCTQLADGNGAAMPTTSITQGSAFVAGAGGKISGTAGSNDQWSIDQFKALTNVIDGTN